ncbi:MAG TPA: adenylosuccinate lyase [Polyangia bacterium]|jgi:adenylosuccinate lyase|nr:adenylosuccinate lyase [Polyangia bacterium]
MIARYSRPEMTALWSEGRRFQVWLEVELAACAAMERHGLVPAGTAEAVRAAAMDRLEPARILEIERRTRHDVIAFLTHVEELAGEPARWLHLGMTSSDVLDSALAILLRDALDLILAAMDRLGVVLHRRAEEHRHTPLIGRSHGVHAEPVTLGLVFAGFHAEASRNCDRLRAARRSIAVGKIAGAVGTYAHLSPEIEREALAALGLEPETVATQVVARDRHAELFQTLALLGSSIERLALTVRHWQRTEVGEAEEAFGAGQKGSSAMPHKKNPILAENLTGLARLLRGYAASALEDVALWHERDISHSSVERVIAPDATTLAEFLLQRAADLVEGLVVHPEKMRSNLDLTRGLIYSEGVMLELVRTGLPRQQAYEMVQRAALRARDEAHTTGKTLREYLAADPEVVARLGTERLDACFDLGHHLRHVDAIFERCFGRAAEDAAGPGAGGGSGEGGEDAR